MVILMKYDGVQRIFVGDFETTVYAGQENTLVWASALVELNTENVKIVGSIDEQIQDFINLKSNILVYYHNLKFDGSFILDYLIRDKRFSQAWSESRNDFVADKYMKDYSFKYLVSDMGQWYTITIKVDGYYIQIRDSLKLLPFSVKQIGKAFKTKHQKLDMEYEGFRYPNCPISEQEREYIRNDVLVIKECLEVMQEENHTKMTIGSCCMTEFKKGFDRQELKSFFPNLEHIQFNDTNADEYIRNSYRGGWCYVVKGAENIEYGNGCTADVNSLYPSMMSSESGNAYPVGSPMFWEGDYIPEQAQGINRYYFVRVRCEFIIRDGYLPFIQIKRDWKYKGNEMLETSDVFDLQGNRYSNPVILTFTMTDWELFKEHYHVFNCEILDGCYFFSEVGIFDDYIEKYKKIKIESKGAKRALAKLFLNNLYGKLATSNNSSFKLAVLKPDGNIGFKTIMKHDKPTVHIGMGSAITSYARNFTIRTAQKNYYGVDKEGFKYADTDSIHCNFEKERLIDVPVHSTNFCKWSLESEWDKAIFVRQKTYIEHVVVEDGEQLDTPYYNIKCAGMPQRCKTLLNASITGESIETINDDEKRFIMENRTLKDFKTGIIVPSKLMPKRIQGGILLTMTNYKMK